MTSTIIHFTVNGKLERAEFGAECPAADVKGVFLAAAEAGPQHVLKLYSRSGRVLNICPQLEANGPGSCYRLEVVASEPHGVGTSSELDAMEHRLKHLEGKVIADVGSTPDVVCDLKSRVESFRRKLESVDHLSWMGLFKEDSDHDPPESSPKPKSRPQEQRRQVRRKFITLSSLRVTEEVREHLKNPTFDNWQWEEAEMLLLLQVMFSDLDFLSVFHIPLDVLQNFLFGVYCHYNAVPFHNFRHCFCVTQMMYALIWLTDLRSQIPAVDLLILLTSALCHDLDHPGFSNVYQINARTALALRYNDISPLENHHCAVAFAIMSQPECDILRNLSSEQYKHVRGGVIRCILATDMAKHDEILGMFRSIRGGFSFSNQEHKEVLMKILVKVSDISKEARPMAVAERWLDCLLQEFFHQSDTEKLRGLPVTPFMDRDKVSKPSSQTGFIRFVLLPLFTELTALFPRLEEHLLEPVRRALDYYSELERASKQEEAEEGRSTAGGGGEEHNRRRRRRGARQEEEVEKLSREVVTSEN